MTINHIGIFSFFDVSRLAGFFPESDRAELEALPHPYAATAVNNLIFGFRRKGVRLSLFTLCPQLTECRVFHGDGVSLYLSPLRRRGKLRAATFYYSEIKNMRRHLAGMADPPQILEAHWTYEFALAIADSPLPKFIFYRDWPPVILRFYRNFYWLCRYLMAQKAMRIKDAMYIANSTYMAAQVKSRFKTDIPILPNPLNEEFFTAPRRARGALTDILFIGDDGDRKNLISLLKAMALLRGKRPELALNVVGVEKDSPKIRQFSRSGLLENVNICGRVGRKELAEMLDRSALFVHPSREESFGNVLLEAMARGVPVIGGEKSGAVPEVLSGGKAGVLCDVNSPEAIAAAMDGLLDSDERYRSFSEAGYRFCRDNFGLDRVIERHLELYESRLRELEK